MNRRQAYDRAYRAAHNDEARDHDAVHKGEAHAYARARYAAHNDESRDSQRAYYEAYNDERRDKAERKKPI